MSGVRSRTDELRAASGFLRGLRSFLVEDRAERPAPLPRIEHQISDRERSFVRLLDRAVLANPASPYRRLLAWAGVERGDLLAMLADDGLSGLLTRLHGAGVHVSLEEFKGRRPIQRPGLEIAVRSADFDNPLTVRQYLAETGGSTGTARPIQVDLDLLECESAYHALFYEAAGLSDRPLGIWHLAPPGVVGLKTALIQAHLGRPAERWFSQRRLGDTSLKHSLLTRATLLAASLYGARVPPPEYAPAADARRVAEWLARSRDLGRPAVLVTTASAAVRTCTAALDAGLGIAESYFVLVGEPYTRAKAAVIAAAGCRASSHYAMTEAGLIGLACTASDEPDDVHLLGDKIATIERETKVGGDGASVLALFHTTVLPCSPKILLNVESGDVGVRERRSCGCGALPSHDDHLHTIRSYEKLTSEGMHLLAGDLLCLVEDLLPSRFGGRPTDYQLIEREEAGLPRILLVVRPSVGPLDEGRVVETVLRFLRERSAGHRLMADVWDQGRTLTVVRDEPQATRGAKIPALRTLAD